MLHNTEGNSSSQQPGVLFKGTTSRGLMPRSNSWLALSACPLDCGCATDARSSRMCSFWQNRCITPSDRLEPLSAMMLWGYPNLYMIFFKNFSAVAASHLLTGSASTHLVNFSTSTSMWVFLFADLLKGPTISSPHTAKG